jgi:hypothetical protein
MSRQYRIRVYGTQRKNIDPALLAQVVILFGRHLHQQRQQQQQRLQVTEHAKTATSSSVSGNPRNPNVAHAEPSSGDRSRTPEGDEDSEGAVGGRLLP